MSCGADLLRHIDSSQLKTLDLLGLVDNESSESRPAVERSWACRRIELLSEDVIVSRAWSVRILWPERIGLEAKTPRPFPIACRTVNIAGW